MNLVISKTVLPTILMPIAGCLMHIPLYYFNRADIKDYAFQLLLGIVIGTTSLIFIAGRFCFFSGFK